MPAPKWLKPFILATLCVWWPTARHCVATAESHRPTSATRHYSRSQRSTECVCVCACVFVCVVKEGPLDFESYFLDYWGHFLFVPQPYETRWSSHKCCLSRKIEGAGGGIGIEKEVGREDSEEGMTGWEAVTGKTEKGGRKKRKGERGCESPSSDNKAFPMTPPSGQELKPGNRTAAALKTGVRRWRERNSGAGKKSEREGRRFEMLWPYYLHTAGRTVEILPL